MKKALILFFPLIAFGAQAQVIPVGFIKKKNTIPPTLGSTSTYFSLGLVDATISGNITSAGGSSITVSGICYSATNTIPTITDNVTTNGSTSIGLFKSLISGLTSNTTYYARAYATNSDGTSYGNTVIFSTYGTVVTLTGRTWLDRNLGASRVATSATDASAIGDFFQWGRSADGHESQWRRNNNINGWTNVASTTTVPTNDRWIYVAPGNDWLVTADITLWHSDNAPNNPCPSGYRIPTEQEWVAEYQKFSSNNAAGAFSSSLKLTAAGGVLGTFSNSGAGFLYTANAYYATQTANNSTTYPARPYSVKYTGINSSNIWQDTNLQKGYGYSCRCIQLN